MKRRSLRITRYILIGLITIAVGLTVTKLVQTDAEADDQIEQIDAFITSHELRNASHEEPETVSLSYEEWKEQQNDDSNVIDTESDDIDSAGCDIPSNESESVDVWSLGLDRGISELDTTRTLKLITYEGYGESPLSYYVACCCYVRATENYWGYPNLFEAFGEIDSVSNGGQYGEWMDDLEIADYAFDALTECYLNPSYVKYCNGMTVPQEWVYSESGVYVW